MLMLFAVTGWATEIGQPMVTLTQNAEDNTKLDVTITCENAEGIVFNINSNDDPDLNSPNFVDGYQINLKTVPSPVTVKAVGYDAEYNLGEVGSDVGRTLTVSVTNINDGVQANSMFYYYVPFPTETLADALAGEEGDVALSETAKVVR